MNLNLTEIDSNYEPITEYTPEPGFIDTVKASFENFRSVNLSNSKDKHYKEVMSEKSTEWSNRNLNNKELYERIANYDIRDMEKLEALYNENPDSVKGFIKTNPFNVDVFLTEDFLKMKAIQKTEGLESFESINQQVLDKAKQEHDESAKVLADSPHWGAEMLGTMGAALTDIKTLQTLPLGTYSAGRGLVGNALYSFGQEFGIEALAQTSIAPEVYSFKKELGMKTSVIQEATTAVASMATAGLVRGAASAVFDLTPLGKTALRTKDPELADEYDQLVKSQATDSVDDHVMALHKTEFGTPVNKIENPNEEGIKLNAADDIIEHDIPTQKEVIEIEEPDLEIVTGKTLEGDIETKSYKELSDDIEAEAEHFRSIEKCLL